MSVNKPGSEEIERRIEELADWLLNESEAEMAQVTSRRGSAKGMRGCSEQDLKYAANLAGKMMGRKLTPSTQEENEKSCDVQERIAGKIEVKARQLENWGHLVRTLIPSIKQEAYRELGDVYEIFNTLEEYGFSVVPAGLGPDGKRSFWYVGFVQVSDAGDLDLMSPENTSVGRAEKLIDAVRKAAAITEKSKL